MTGPHLHLDELIAHFLELSQSIAEAIISDESVENVRRLDQKLSQTFDAILDHEPRDLEESRSKAHFILDQIVHSEDRSTRQQLADQLKKHDISG